MSCIQNVIDGDLCELFNSLESAKRRGIAEELDRTPAEVCVEFSLVNIHVPPVYYMAD